MTKLDTITWIKHYPRPRPKTNVWQRATGEEPKPKWHKIKHGVHDNMTTVCGLKLSLAMLGNSDMKDKRPTTALKCKLCDR